MTNLRTGKVILRTLAILVVFTDASSAFQNSSDQTLVDQFYPQKLAGESNQQAQAGGPRPFRDSSFVVAQLNGSGNGDFIVAAYTNGYGAVVRVLSKRNGTATLVSEPNLLMGGIYSSVRLLDVDNDNQPEVIVGFTSATGPISTWVFRWAGNQLVSIGPATTESGDTATLLNDPAFIDLDGDGILEIVNGVDPDDPAQVMQVFKLKNGSYSLSKSVNFFGTFVRHAGAPETVEHSFSVPKPQGRYTLRIINGAGSGNRVSSASVRLNGSIVAGPNQFNQQAREIVVPVSLLSDNTVSAQLQGVPGGQIAVTIEPQD